MKMQTIIKTMMLGALMLGGGACFADTLLLDTFDTADSQDINTNLIVRQSGTQATVAWTDSKANNYQTQINSQALRIYASGAGSVFAQPDKDFATVAGNVRISVDIKDNNTTNGFSMVNFGMAASDGFVGTKGYSFRLDSRTGIVLLNFYDNGIQKGSMNVDALADGGFESLVVDFSGGNTVSATFNGAVYDFGSGQTSYAGTTETENRVMLGWYGTGGLTSASFNNLRVASIPAPIQEVVLLQDTFGTVDTNDINYDLLNRQSGSLATASWTNNGYGVAISGGTLRASTTGSAASSLIRLERDFATVTNKVRISVGMKNANPADGFSMVNFGMATADGFSANAGYSFRLDTRFGVKLLKFYDNTSTIAASMDVTALLSGGFDSLVIEFSEGNTISATFNGTAYDFGSGQTSYTGTSEAENHVMLGWFGDGTPGVTSAMFDNLKVTVIAEPVPPGPITPATIVGWSVFSTNVMRMVVDAPDSATNYYPKTISDLVNGTWTNVAHSIDGSDPFIVTNLSYSTADGSNEVIYVQADSAAGFFGIGE
ncbi:MAG: hypothetical protein K9M54_00710 [Kiritimatiellales bacterium]|nr:hypothetical protein [Kiritimatiellales bacterium]MCF7864187.1 hypothetical protein [Kiritimatiellales bacterium]